MKLHLNRFPDLFVYSDAAEAAWVLASPVFYFASPIGRSITSWMIK